MYYQTDFGAIVTWIAVSNTVLFFVNFNTTNKITLQPTYDSLVLLINTEIGDIKKNGFLFVLLNCLFYRFPDCSQNNNIFQLEQRSLLN